MSSKLKLNLSDLSVESFVTVENIQGGYRPTFNTCTAYVQYCPSGDGNCDGTRPDENNGCPAVSNGNPACR